MNTNEIIIEDGEKRILLLVGWYSELELSEYINELKNYQEK